MFASMWRVGWNQPGSCQFGNLVLYHNLCKKSIVTPPSFQLLACSGQLHNEIITLI